MTDFISNVDLICYMPEYENDLGYVAQVSRNKGFAQYKGEKPYAYNTIGGGNANENLDASVKTLRFCMKSGHLSILEFAQLVFRIECPIFVARQLMRYRNASYIERSLRYCEPTTRDWMKEIRSPNEADSPYSTIVGHEEYSRTVYDDLVAYGSRKEYARAVLPLSVQTVYLMRVDLRELLHIFDERLTPHCQKETRDVVQAMYDITKSLFPVVIEEYEKSSTVQ